MPLQNFGSILNFAAELEWKDYLFCLSAENNHACIETNKKTCRA